MVYNPKCVFAWRNKKDSDFITEVRGAEENLSNPAFNLVLPAPATVISLLDQLQVYIVQSNQRDYRNTASRRLLRKQLNIMVQAQCDSVNYIAQGDVSMMELSGFPLSKIPTPHQVPDQGLIKKIVRLDAGTAAITTKALRNCKYYKVEVEGPAGFKAEENGTFCKFKVANLPLDVTLKVRVCGINNKGVGLWSPWVDFTVSATSPVGTANEND